MRLRLSSGPTPVPINDFGRLAGPPAPYGFESLLRPHPHGRFEQRGNPPKVKAGVAVGEFSDIVMVNTPPNSRSALEGKPGYPTSIAVPAAAKCTWRSGRDATPRSSGRLAKNAAGWSVAR